MTRIVIAEDHALIRTALRTMLAQSEGIEVVAEAETGAEAVRAVALHRPDMVVMDITMPMMTGLEAAAAIAAQHPETRLLALSMHKGEEYLHQALQSGFHGYVPKGADWDELLLAISTVMSGKCYISPALGANPPEQLFETNTQALSELRKLSGRQYEVLKSLALGQTSKEIAFRLGISPKTVDAHRIALMKRLRIDNLASLVRFAIQEGVIT